jgi:hypothetical protein
MKQGIEPINFLPIWKGDGLACFFERERERERAGGGDVILKKALGIIFSKNLNLFYKNNSPNLGFNSSFQKRWFQGLDSIPIFSKFCEPLVWIPQNLTYNLNLQIT